MRNQLCSVLFCVLFGAAVNPPLFATATLTLQNAPASTITVGGNGVPINATFDPDSSDYSILSNSALAQATQGYGTYTDQVGQNFIILQPIPSKAPPFNLQLGNYQFLPGTPKGTEITGVTISLFYTLYSVNPNSPTFDPIADYVSSDDVLVSNLTIEDEQGNAGPPLQAAVPEPGSWLLAAAGLLLLSCSLLRKQA